MEPCVEATVTAVLEDERKLTATVRAYSEMNIYIDKLFTEFKKYPVRYNERESGKGGMVYQCNLGL